MTSQKVRELVNWGDAALEQSDLDDAESAYARAIEAGRTSGGGIALALDGLMRLASRYVMLGFLGRPHALHRYFIETDTLDVARDLKDLANLRDTQGDIKGCEMILTRILELKLDVLGPAHEETLAALQDAALVLQTQGKSPEHLYKLAFSRKAEDWVEIEPSSEQSAEPLQKSVENTDLPASSVEFSEPLSEAVGASSNIDVPSEAQPQEMFPPPPSSPVAFAPLPSSPAPVSFTAPAPWPEPTPSTSWSSESAQSSGSDSNNLQGAADALLAKTAAPQADNPFASASYSLFAQPPEVPPQKLSGEISNSYQSKVEALLSAEAFRAYLPQDDEPSPAPHDAWADPRGPVSPAYSNPAWTGGASGVAAAPEEDLWARETSGGIYGYSEETWTPGLSVGNASAPYSPEKAWGSEASEDTSVAGADPWSLVPFTESPFYSSETARGSESDEDLWTKETGVGLPVYSEPQGSITSDEELWTKETGVGLPVYSEPQGSTTSDEDLWTKETGVGLPVYSEPQGSTTSDEELWTKETGVGLPVYSESQGSTTSDEELWTKETGVGLPVYSEPQGSTKSDEDLWTRETGVGLPVYSEPQGSTTSDEDLWTRETGVGLPVYSEPQGSTTSDEDLWTRETGVGLPVYSEPQGGSSSGEPVSGSRQDVNIAGEEANWTKETFAGIPAYSENSSLSLTGDGVIDESIAMQHRIPVIAPETTWLQETSGDLPVYSESSRLIEPGQSEQSRAVEVSSSTPEILQPQSQYFLAAAASQFISSSTHRQAPELPIAAAPVQSAAQSFEQPASQPVEASPSESLTHAHASPADESFWNDCLDYLKKRIDHCACDQQLKRFIALTGMIHDALERARPLASTGDTATVALATISRIDWKILNDLGEMYEKLSGTNAAAYELSLIYALSIRIAALGAKHTDTTLTLDRLCRLYKLLGIGDLALPVRRVLLKLSGMEEESVPSDETLPISRRVQPSAPKQEQVLNDPVSTIRAHFLILSKNPPKEDSIRIIQEVRAAFNRLSAPEVAPFLSRLLELAANILGEDHPETAGCLFDAARFAKELQRPGFERAFQKAFHIYLKAGATGPAVASCAFEFANVCKAIDDSESGRLRTRAVAVCSMTYGLLHHKTRQIVSPLDTRLISLEFDFATRSDETRPGMEANPLTNFSGSSSDMVAALLRDTRILESCRVKQDDNAVSQAIDEVCSVFAGHDLFATSADIAPVELVVLALMLEYQALRVLDQRNFLVAERILETADRIRQVVLPAGHADHALSLFRRGFIYARLNDLDSAERFYKKSVDILEPIRGEQLLLHAAVLNNLGAVEFRRADYTQAARYFDRAYNQMEVMTDVAPLLDICRANISQVKEIRVFLAKLE
ncbi:MAG: tetratricopeptide repeat protein [Candidatus Obscuribacterales bacterium]|nr:tetratricopeptide repeat protein [Candidatus Obscuribacterales bacterium]